MQLGGEIDELILVGLKGSNSWPISNRIVDSPSDQGNDPIQWGHGSPVITLPFPLRLIPKGLRGRLGDEVRFRLIRRRDKP